MQLISKFNKGFCFLLCVIDVYSKYAWVVYQLLMLFKSFLRSLDINKVKYEYIKAGNFTIDQRNHGYKITIQKCIQSKMKRTLLLLKDLLEP